MEKVRVSIWGFGAMGSGMAKVLLNKKGVEITGVCDLHPNRIGKSIFELLNMERGDNKEVIITDQVEQVIYPNSSDICLIATDSFIVKAFPKIKYVLEQKINVISTAEEMAFPKASNEELANQLNEIALQNGVTVLGTGINPGFILDLLVVCLTGCMTDVESIVAKRINSLSPFGPLVMEEQGVGLSVSEYDELVRNKKLAGHVGFKESTYMIAEALGLQVDRFSQTMEPIITNVDRVSPYGEAKKGHVAGVNMTSSSVMNGKPFLELIHPQQIEPEMEQTYTGDYITIQGTPSVNMSITPEVEGGIGTIAMCVNMIPHVINAKPGLKTMIDLPIPRAILGDMSKMIHNDLE